MGSHGELLEACGLYSAMWSRQQSDAAWSSEAVPSTAGGPGDAGLQGGASFSQPDPRRTTMRKQDSSRILAPGYRDLARLDTGLKDADFDAQRMGMHKTGSLSCRNNAAAGTSQLP